MSEAQQQAMDATNNQKYQAYILSFDGINLTREAIEAQQAENEHVAPDTESGEFPLRLTVPSA